MKLNRPAQTGTVRRGAVDLANLIRHLRQFYSPNELEMLYLVYTDGKPIPDCRNPRQQMPDAERQLRIEAIRQILNITPPALVNEPVAEKSKKPAK